MKVRGIAGLAVLWLATASCRTPTSTAAIEETDHQPAATQEVIMVASKTSDRLIELTRTFSAPRDAVFAAMTQPAHLLRWMKTANMEFVACDVDLRAGGTLRYVFQRPSGTKIEVRGAVTAVDAPRQWTYIETYDFSPLRIEVTTALDEAGAKTVFRQTLRYASKAERDADYDGVATSSAESYDNLDRYLRSADALDRR